jgi:regulator of PEP synthase PpsR (kinase-PPPase family)
MKQNSDWINKFYTKPTQDLEAKTDVVNTSKMRETLVMQDNYFSLVVEINFIINQDD